MFIIDITVFRSKHQHSVGSLFMTCIVLPIVGSAVLFAGCAKEVIDSSSPSSVTSCDMNEYCRSNVGSLSYCKDWLSVSTCQGGDQYVDCSTCGGETPSSVTIGPTDSVDSADPVSPVEPSVAPSSDACEHRGASEVPLFVWLEGTGSMHSVSEFAALFQQIRQFVQYNCVNMRVTTLVVRTPNPVYPTQSAEPVYWPPSSSPLFTELIAQLGPETPVKILLYPYIMEDFDRTAWVQFAQSTGAKRVGSTYTVYDGIFAFTKGWQDFVRSRSSSVQIEGFMIDYEEIYRKMGSINVVALDQTTFQPYRSAYPSIKTGVTVGYDHGSAIKSFAPYMDTIHLQVYDLYYPYAGSDESKTDSVFEKYKDDPQTLANIVLSKVFIPSVLANYQGLGDKIKLMWSTQTLVPGGCLYPLNTGKCGVNYEFNWRPDTFNEFMRIVQSSQSAIAPYEHGVYTFNFMRPDWLVKSSRP